MKRTGRLLFSCLCFIVTLSLTASTKPTTTIEMTDPATTTCDSSDSVVVVVAAAANDPPKASWWEGVPTLLLRKTTLIPESENHLPVHTLTFEIPPSNTSAENSRVKPHAALQLDLGDIVKMVIPGYKPKSYSVSALRVDDHEFDVTFKVYPNGRASGYLDRLQVGTSTSHSFGMSSTRIRQPGAYVGIVAYGVGMTEALPVTRAELAKGDAKQVVLLWASRTMADTFWMDQLQALQQEYPDTFTLQLILSRQPEASTTTTTTAILHGRITPDTLSQVFTVEEAGIQPSEARFLSVGTKEMMKLTDGMLSQIGFPMPQHALIPKAPKSK
jgi:ferredoxin-NADP reductase